MALVRAGPGCVRKPKVTKRQERRREEPAFTKRKRSSCSDGQATPQPPPKKILPAVQQTLHTTPSQSPSSTPSSSPARSVSSARAPPEPAERREKLRAQSFENPKKTQVKLIQDSSGASKDTEPNHRELSIFWRIMDQWPKLDENLIKPLQFWWSELASDRKTSLEEKILLLVQSPNGVTNCLHHLAGNLLYEHVNEQDMLDDSTKCFEELEEAFQELHYPKYLEVLQSCDCTDCCSVVEFDADYERYY